MLNVPIQEIVDYLLVGTRVDGRGEWGTLMATGTYGFIAEQRRLAREEVQKEDI